MNMLHSFFVLVACAVAVAAQPTPAARESPCESPTYDGKAVTMNMICSGITQTLELNNCIGNNNGDLGRGADFSSTCSNVEVISGALTLSAKCISRGGVSVGSTIDLGQFVAADHETLACPA
ncbi:hypothetical protein C8R47DRAFT_1062828 [Mycena vitilis]|nr:hypothetical protein C8R47DRAFT_1062828 [Mycena vitilis]